MSRARDLADRVLHNRTHEDTEGGRESNLTFKGEQSGGEISTLAQIQASHDGTGDDQKADLIFKTNDGSDNATPTEAARIDSQSNFLIGHSDNINVAGHEAGLQIVGQGTADYHGSTISIIGNANNSNGAYLNFAKTRSNTAGAFTAAAAGDVVGSIIFSAADGTDLANSVAHVLAKVNDNVASNDTAGRLEFATTAQGSGTPATRVRIDEHGIKFGSDTAEANALNDYERGLHTISINQGGIGFHSLYQNFQYIKIGDFVNVHGLCLVTSSGDSNDLRINMPFTSKQTGIGQTADATHGLVSSYGVPTGSGGIRCTISKGTSQLRFLKTVDNAAWTTLLGNELANNDHLYVNITYEVA